MEPRYLGDGVYVQPWEAGGLIITSGSHRLHEADETIYLDPAVLEGLQDYLKAYKESK